jgi:hypothetical protein
MSRVRSTAQPIGGAATSSSGGEGGGSEERTISARPRDAGLPSDGGDVRVESSCSQSFYFGPSTVTVSRIHGMINSGYFADGMSREPGREIVAKPHVDEAVLFEEFFIASLRMPPHPVLVAILLKYQIQIHHLTPNAIVRLSKYIWAGTSFGDVPSAKGFTKRYELHYQPRKMDVDGAEVQGQYGCINFHEKHGSQQAKLTVVVKNKWARGWMQTWFYCKVPLIHSPSPG